MKKIVLSIFVLTEIVSKINAQTSWGINTGVDLSKKTGYSGLGINTGPIVTPEADVFCMIQSPARTVAFQPSIGYSAKGIVMKNVLVVDNLGNPLGRGDATMRLDYLSLSLPAQFISPSNRVNYLAGLGPYLGWLFGGKEKYKNFKPDQPSLLKPKSHGLFMPDFNRVDIGLVAKFTVKRKKIIAFFEFEQGFLNTNKKGTIKSKNTSAGAGVGYIFAGK